MVNIGAITTAVSGSVGVLKEIGSIAKRAGNREINEHLLDLQQRIIEVQGLLTELISENETLRRRIAELENAAKTEGELKFEESAYWMVRDGKRFDGPLCPNCWDDKRKSVHLTPNESRGLYYCGVCKSGPFIIGEDKRASIAFVSSGPSKFNEVL